MMLKLTLAFASSLATAASGRQWRLGLFYPSAAENPDCRLDTPDLHSAQFFTIVPTSTCAPLQDSTEDEYYIFTNSSAQGQCLKAGCDATCFHCRLVQGNCSHFTAPPTSAPSTGLSTTHSPDTTRTPHPTHTSATIRTTGTTRAPITTTPHGSGNGSGSGSGSGSGPGLAQDAVKDNDLAEAMSDEILSCGSTVVGTTVAGLNVIGNESPDKLYTFVVDKNSKVQLDTCDSHFSVVPRVYSLDGDEVAMCQDCDCEFDLATGTYAILVEGTSAQSFGEFELAIDCNSKQRTRRESSAAPLANKCYSNINAVDGMYTSGFLYYLSELDNATEHGLCVGNSNISVRQPVVLYFAGGCSGTTADETATIKADVLNDNVCNRDNSLVSITSAGTFNVSINCLAGNCSEACTVVEHDLPDTGVCLNGTYKVYTSMDFETCGSAAPPLPPSDTTASPHHDTAKSKSSSPVGAIVGSIVGALAIGGAVFFVVRRRKLSRMNAYAVLQDDPAF